MGEYLLRFLIGGAAVSLFAVLADMLRPKSFAGLFGAAPSIALSTLAMALASEAPAYVANEGRAMMVGALALAACSILVCQLVARWHLKTLPASLLGLILWFAVALAGRHFLSG